MADVGNHRGDGLAGDGFLNRPEQLDGRLRPAEDDGFGIDAVPAEPKGVGDADILAVTAQLHQKDRGTVFTLHPASGGESKAKGCAGVACSSRKDLVDEALRKIEELGRIRGGPAKTGKTGGSFDAFNAGAEVLQHPLFRKAIHLGLPKVQIENK